MDNKINEFSGTNNNQKEEAMSKKELDRFYNQELPEYVCAVRFDLRDRDVLLSAKLLEAADKEDWTGVTALLEQGADPRICRITDGTTCESALYLALKTTRFEEAEALYDAGDRLDDLWAGDESIPAEILNYLTYETANGRNYFVDEDKPLSECIRCGLWTQAEEKIEHASPEELNLAVEMIGYHLTERNTESYLAILLDLQKRGADIARFREELLGQWKRFQNLPKLLRPNEEALRQITEIVRNA